MRFLIYSLLPVCLFNQQLEAQTKVQSEQNYVYDRPGPFDFTKHIPGDIIDYGKITFTKKNILPITGMAVGTALLVLVDQPIVDNAQKFGDKIELKHSSHQTTIFEPGINVSGKKLSFPINVPTDLNSGMYFLGDGITHFSIAGAFWLTGLISDDNRALQTASELTESILTTGFSTQLLKHITGRESPYVSTAPAGVWRVFPNQRDYAKNVPHYDAYPSGHLATAMATVTVIAENYPEYKFVRPVGYTLMGVLAYAMLNNGVHWFSDYPLALALGYTFAEISVHKGRRSFKKLPPVEEDDSPSLGLRDFKITPLVGKDFAGAGIKLIFR